MNQRAWEVILEKVRGGAKMLLTGRFDAHEHFRTRSRDLGIEFRPGIFRVEDNVPAQAGGDVAQVTDRGGQPADLHIRIGPLAAPDTVEKTPLMRKMVGPTELESVTSTVSR